MTSVDQSRSKAKNATAVTAAANAAVMGALPFGDRLDFEDIARGLIAKAPAGAIVGRRRPVDLGHERVRVRDHRRRARDGEPQPVASGAAEQHRRPVPGHRPDLPAARLRPLEHVDHRGRHRPDRDRPADLGRVREGRHGPLPVAARRQAGRRRDLHAQPHRPLRRRQGDHVGGGRRGRQGEDLRAGRIPLPRDQRERVRRHRDEPSFPLPVRRLPAARRTRPGRPRARQGHLQRCHHPDRADRPHHRGRRRARSTACSSNSSSRRAPRRRPR